MTQEINIKLRADTREAVKSVKDLERQVSNLEDLQRKGDSDKGFLSADDVKRFRRMSAEAERIYRQFFEQYSRTQRDFEKKKKELEEAQKRGAGSSTTQQLERELQELEARRNIYKSQEQNMNHLQNSQQSSTRNINDMNSPSSFGNMLMMSRKLLPMLGLTLGVGTLFNVAKQGMQQIKVDEGYMSKLGQRVPGYNGDFEKGRKDAEAVGLQNGNAYKALETMQTAENYTSIAGAKNSKDMWKATSELQTMGRVTGLDPAELAQYGGQLSRWGAFDAKSLKGFRESMVGAIKETGMAGRDREFIQAVSGLSNQVGRGQMELSNGEFNQILGLQTLLGKADKGFQGERGAEVLSALDSGVKGKDNAIDVMLGWGSEFQGIEGRAKLEKMKGRGISDPEVAKRLFTNIDKMAGGNKEYQALWLQDKFGISYEQSERLLQDDILSQLKKGGLSQKDIEGIMNSGKLESDKKSKDWQGSDAQRRANNDARWENSKKYGGSFLDKAWNGAKDMFLSQPDWLQWGEMGAGAFGGGMLAKKAIPSIGRFFSSKIGGGGGRAGASAGSMLSKAGKLLGPIGSFMSLKWASDVGDGLGDWLFGHSKGDLKMKSLMSNPLSPNEKWKDDKKGVFEKGWDWLVGNNNKASAAELSPEEVKKKADDEKEKQKSRADKESKTKQEELLNKERTNIEKRKGQADDQKIALEGERKNLDEMKNVFGIGSVTRKSSSSGTSSSGGGFFGGLIDGIKGFLTGGIGGAVTGFLQGSAGGSGGGGATNTNFAPTGMSNSSFLNQNLKQKSNLSAEDINGWIAKNAKAGSVMLGKGDVFLKASQESGLDVRYLVAHAAEETGWGSSNIAKTKGNMYGIGAFDASPYSSAYGYNNSDAGIVEGAKWIAKNYVNKGQDTLYKMKNDPNGHEYATNSSWDDNIAAIMAGGPKGSGSSLASANTQTLNVKVSGGIDGLTKENNDMVTQALTKNLTSNNVQLAYEFRQGIGGNR